MVARISQTIEPLRFHFVALKSLESSHGTPGHLRFGTEGLQTAKELLGAALNPFAGTLHVLAKAVGRPAADADNGQECGGKEQKNETLHQRDVICLHRVLIEPRTRADAMGCLPHLKCGVEPNPGTSDGGTLTR